MALNQGQSAMCCGVPEVTPAKHNIDLTDELHFSSLRWANQWDLLQSCLDAMEVFLSLCDSSAECSKATAPSLCSF